MIKDIVILLLSLTAIILSLMFLFGNLWGALPSTLGCFGLVYSVGNLITPAIDKLFKEEL